MIPIDIDADGYELSDDLRRSIAERIGSLDGHMADLTHGHVTVAWEGGKELTAVHAQVWGPHHRFDASETDRHPVSAVDGVRHRLETQIRREHGKELDRRHGR